MSSWSAPGISTKGWLSGNAYKMCDIVRLIRSCHLPPQAWEPPGRIILHVVTASYCTVTVSVGQAWQVKFEIEQLNYFFQYKYNA